jgi:transcriptional regulator
MLVGLLLVSRTATTIGMYIPESFRIVDEPEIEAFLQRYDFATIVTPAPETLIATHVPVAVKRDGPRLVLLGHVAKANPHWKSMDGTIESLVIFHGPHGYVSPRWYATSPAVPTWNYAVVHAYGRPQTREEPAFIEALLVDLLRRYEGSGSDAWRIEDLPVDYRSRQLSGIVGFEMPVLRLEAKFKLGQNRAAIDRARTIEELERKNSSEASNLAAFMRAHVKDG